MKLSGRRFATPIALAVAALFFASGAAAATVTNLAEAKLHGRQLVQQLLGQLRPATNYTQTGVLKIRPAKGKTLELPLRCEVRVTPTNWQSLYETVITNADGSPGGGYLKIVHVGNQPGEYTWRNSGSSQADRGGPDPGEEQWSGTKWTYPFSGSDFWAVDMGLEFVLWPEQRVLRHEFRSTLGCSVLESTNPDPAADGYARVLSWIDNESGGIVYAEAYNASGKKLKEYDTKKLRKVNGQWRVEEMQIFNSQTGSRTRIDFDLKPD
jgi:hypothetical protein